MILLLLLPHVQMLVRNADGDGDGTLDLAEFLAAFTASFLEEGMTAAGKAWGPDTLVQLPRDPESGRQNPLAAITKHYSRDPTELESGIVPGSSGSYLMKRSEINDAIWEYLLRQIFLLALPLFRSTDIFDGAGTSSRTS